VILCCYMRLLDDLTWFKLFFVVIMCGDIYLGVLTCE